MKTKTQMSLVVTIAIVLISFFVIGEVVREKLLGDADIKTKENACKIANQLGQQTGVDTIRDNALKACSVIDLGNLPEKKYDNTKTGLMKNIADKVAKTWDIWLEGVKENYFDSNWFSSEQRCFIQYTFNIKKGLDPISKIELEEYLHDTLYKIADTSDRCAGTNGGYCKKECEPDETKIEASKECIGEKGYCCLKKTKCESRGGTCSKTCSGDKTFYKNWPCELGKMCCIDNSNYVTYLDYVQANTGAVDIYGKLYPQDFKQGNRKISETYAIVFVSKTTTWFPGLGEKEKDVNKVVITPLNLVSGKCAVQYSTSA